MAMETMTREGFRNFVKDAVSEYLPDNYEIFVQSVNKPSGAYTGVGAREKGSKIAPVINTDDFYPRYLNGECLVDLLKEISNTFINAPRPVTNDFIDWVNDYNKVKSHLFIKVLNDRSVPDGVLKRTKMDIAIIPYVLIQKDSNGFSAFAVTEDLLKMWDVNGDDIIEDAISNGNELFPLRISSIAEELGFDEGDDDTPFRIITVEGKQGGAAAVFYPDTLERVSELFGGDFMLLPSSVHEMLALPHVADFEVDAYREMVMKINSEVVDERDRLTDSVYRYHHDRRELVKEA